MKTGTPIEVIGARMHNLRNITVRIPVGRLTVITGRSGAGKSSLVIDTLFAEGQRRYVESLSTYTRQFLQRMQKPDVDEIRGIMPAVAIRQHIYARNPRSTVGTVTEVYDFLRLLFARLAHYVCPRCERVVTVDTPPTVWQWLLEHWAGASVAVLAPIPVDVEHPEDQMARLRREGFLDLWWEGTRVSLDDLGPHRWTSVPTQWLWIGRKRVQLERRDEWIDMLELAFSRGRGRMAVMLPDGQRVDFSSTMACARCGQTFPSLEPSLFSFNRPEGACPVCQGFGDVATIDWDKVIPDRRKPLRAHPIQPWNTPGLRFLYRYLFRAAQRHGWDLDTPWEELPPSVQKAILEGTDHFFGIRGFFRKLEEKRYKRQVRILIARYRTYRPCEACGGTRLRSEARWARIGSISLPELARRPIHEILSWLRSLDLSPTQWQALRRVYEELEQRLQYLVTVGLGYLTLDRLAGTLSGGEAQRIQMAIALGTALSDTLFILDEPSAGLHPRDIEHLVEILHQLRERGNTVVVVEHDPDIIAAADHVIELGPGGGHEGGRVVFEGPPQALRENASTPTARYLQRYFAPATLSCSSRTPQGWIRVYDAHAHNLKSITVRIPLGCMTAITGVSGSGKSTLLQDVLYPAIQEALGQPLPRTPRTWCRVVIEGPITFAALVDQNPPSRNPRATVLSYIGGLAELRQWWARLPDARKRGLDAGAFSWNTRSGRCPVCRGLGFQKIEMIFLSDLRIPCETCHGTRLRPDVLEVRWNGYHFADVLQWTAAQAIEAFRSERMLQPFIRRCETLVAMGLGYLQLHQTLDTLSGGEAQRLKLARFFAETPPHSGVFLLDEPTIGLHGEDISALLGAIHRLLDRGHTVIIVEHHLEVIRQADYIVDLGPEGGEQGGDIIVQGMLREVLRREYPKSHTLRFLRDTIRLITDG